MVLRYRNDNHHAVGWFSGTVTTTVRLTVALSYYFDIFTKFKGGGGCSSTDTFRREASISDSAHEGSMPKLLSIFLSSCMFKDVSLSVSHYDYYHLHFHYRVKN